MKNTELILAKFLTSGVILSGLLMLAGWIKFIKFSYDPFFNFQTYDQIPLRELLDFYLKNKNWGILTSYGGLFVLILLPFFRVFITIFLFLHQKEYLLSVLTLIVLIGLSLGFYLGY